MSSSLSSSTSSDYNPVINGLTVYEHCQVLKHLRKWRDDWITNGNTKSWTKYWKYVKRDLQSKGVYPLTESTNVVKSKESTKVSQPTKTGQPTKSTQAIKKSDGVKKKTSK